MSQPSAQSAPTSRKRGWLSRHGSFRGFQARIKVQGTEYSRLFSDSAYGSEAGARKAGQAWLDSIVQGLPTRYQTGLRQRAAPRKRDKALPVGIGHNTARLRSGTAQERFQVLWHDGHKARAKSFIVGTADTATPRRRRAAKAAAIAFRAAYVKCRAAGRVFEPPAAMLHWSCRDY